LLAREETFDNSGCDPNNTGISKPLLCCCRGGLAESPTLPSAVFVEDASGKAQRVCLSPGKLCAGVSAVDQQIIEAPNCTVRALAWQLNKTSKDGEQKCAEVRLIIEFAAQNKINQL
jgi:hypothetical protein